MLHSIPGSCRGTSLRGGGTCWGNLTLSLRHASDNHIVWPLSLQQHAIKNIRVMPCPSMDDLYTDSCVS